MHVKKGDKVAVIGGVKGKEIPVGKILKVHPKTNRVVVEGVNMRKKHQKPTSEMKKGGIFEQEGTIHVSNVLLYCDKCGRGVRTAKQVLADGSKVRICKKCKETLDK